ncbi:hypothetical protein H0H81_003439 [Sphagnurus paluster]|uniref:Uncharacterized protein n=1 Tax=Sphagnurus paluster TaxID=117069 RepID=A0A9P7FV93_9AGAR|nr:hypothetical protein H0H81_003439 [Sphagnurus paluster]
MFAINQGSGIAVDMDLCDLLHAMQLSTEKTTEEGGVPDAQMHDPSPSYSTGVSPVSSNSSRRSSYGSSESGSASGSASYGCGYLQALQEQLDNYSTTSGEYLEAIFTHREILAAFPAAHRECARGFSDMAGMLEHRAWRADREADAEAVAAFRHEAWSIAISM